MATSTFKTDNHFQAPATFERLAMFIETLPDRLLAQIYTWQRRANDRRHLNQLDDRMLVDIGLNRADIDREIGKPFWQK